MIMATLNNKLVNKQPKFSAAITEEKYKKLINDSIGDVKEAQKFVADMMSVVSSNPQLQNCNAGSLLSGGLTARSLNLPLAGNFGYAYLVPYGDKATFQVGYKGFIQMAMRTGFYSRLGVREVHQGEYVGQDEFGDDIFKFSHDCDENEVVGYFAYFVLDNGFKKTLYWTIDNCKRHAKKYSKAYGTGRATDLWTNEFGLMAQKTVLKQLLSRYGILSTEMQKAIKSDQAVVDVESDTVDYVDNPLDTKVKETKVESKEEVIIEEEKPVTNTSTPQQATLDDFVVDEVLDNGETNEEEIVEELIF